PNAISPVKVGNATLERDLVYSVNLFIVLYLTIVFFSSVLLTLLGIDINEAISGSIASMGNVGPGLGTIGSQGNYSAIPDAGKFIFSVEMLLGRLEIYPLMLMLAIRRWR
ncbi:MAG: TrkH family potassium uptake protein, partial [Bacteroidales bacterium]|nr:TrkH family potassium uptake protein [Bacteroidales bacterium]